MAVRRTYGVVWRVGNSPLARGKLELLPLGLQLEGMTGSQPATCEIAYDHLSEIRIGRSTSERIDSRPSLVLAQRGGDTVSIASVAQPGIVAEIAERLASLQALAKFGSSTARP
jgi:hypothetical protein